MSTEEYILADSGYLFLHSEKVITSYKENQAGRIPQVDRKRFNKEVAKIRIAVEHTIGMLKSRWQSLRGLRQLIRDHTTFTNLIYWIRACVVIHNMLVGLPEDDYWNGEDMAAWQEDWRREAERASQAVVGDEVADVAHITTERQERLRKSLERTEYARAYHGTLEGI